MKAQNYLPAVKKQYEEFPYPERHPEDEEKRLLVPWIAGLDAVNHHCFKGRNNFENFRVLIAGGGTGDSLILWAEQLRDKKGSSVTYLDMSAASMTVAKKRAKVRRLDNITWVNDSLLSMPHAGMEPFDYIDCIGVLHHLKDIDAGLNALASALKPEGAMGLMVYAPYGRSAVYMVQNMMRLVNSAEENPQKKIENTKKMLEALPPHHWYKALQPFGLSNPDAENDAGIHDLFLHSQDRALTILEVHEWLERCGLRMASEPGSYYKQLEYLPETYIKDPALLALVKGYPLKMQQAIGESAQGIVTKHDFYTVRQDAEERLAAVSDTGLIPSSGIFCNFTMDQLAQLSLQRTDPFFVEVTGQPQTRINVPFSRFRHAILSRIDGKKTVQEIVDGIEGDKKEIMRDFETIFISLNRGHMLYLRHPSVEPYLSAVECRTAL